MKHNGKKGVDEYYYRCDEVGDNFYDANIPE